MKKGYIVLLLFVVYVAILYLLAIKYEFREHDLSGKSFFGGFGEYIKYIELSFLISSAFLILVYFIDNKLSLLFILLAPFLNVVVSIFVGLLLNFILWITRLEDATSFFLHVFIIATVSTMGTTIWLLGGMFKVENEKRGIHTP